MKVKIGLGQLLVEGGEPWRNFERAQKMISKAAKEGCDIIHLPETIDFAWTHPSAHTEIDQLQNIVCRCSPDSRGAYDLTGTHDSPRRFQ